jgi:NAD(P)H-dependent flavin oxidoreductase YrpB (nitropropane dioxygenase family)/DNA-binding MarR family transcriptional regulator
MINNALKMEEDALSNHTSHDLSISEIHTLERIGIGKTKTMTDLANEHKISLGAMTTAMNKLVKKGYVERSKTDEDRRIVKIKLTEVGEEAAKEHENFHAHLFQAIFEPMDKQRQADFISLMEKYYDFLSIQAVKPLKSGPELVLKPIRIRGILVERPIFHGDMGLAFSSPATAAQIAKNGGVGLISGANPGLLETDFWSNREEANHRVFIKNLIEGRKLAGEQQDKVAAGLICVSADYHKMVQAALETGVRMIIVGAGMPLSLPALIKGADVALVPIVASARAIAVLIRSWSKKYRRAPDAVIFEGYGKSGHLGIKAGLIDHEKDNFYRSIADIKRELAGLSECPLIVANGPMRKEEIKKVLAYGVDGIQFEEEFASVKENGAIENLRKVYADESRESVIIDSPLGMPARIIRNRLADDILSSTIEIKRCNDCINSCDKLESNFCLSETMAATALGDIRNGILLCSNKSSIINGSSVKTVFDQVKKWELWE